MSYIHFKSVFNKNYDNITFDGPSLSVIELKKLIVAKTKFTKQLDFDLEITNADTNEVYRNESEMIMKNSRVHVKRIMKNSSMPLRAQPPKVSQAPPPVVNTAASEAAASFSMATNSSAQPLKPTPVPTEAIQKPAVEAAVPDATPSSIYIKPPTSVSSSNLHLAATLTSVSQPAAMTHSVSASSITTSSTTLSKSAYDSLAPLNLPSSPIIYKDTSAHKSGELELSQVNLMPANEPKPKLESMLLDTRQDEKAKLESILLATMNSQSHMTVGPNGHKSSQYSTNNTLTQAHLESASGQAPMSAQAIQQTMISGNRYTAGAQWPPRMPPGQHRPLPATYRCTICKKPGHPKNMCPDAGTYVKPEERAKFPSGIPKGKMRPAQPGDKFALLGPDGYVVPILDYEAAQVIKKDKPAFLTEEEEEEEKKRLGYDPNAFTSESTAVKYPPELKCPFGDHIIKDAVLVPCCGHFVCCDDCIREKISKDEVVECPHEDCDQEIGSLESITPYHNTRKMVNEFLAERRANKESSQAAKATGGSSDAFLDALLDDVDVKFSKDPEQQKSPKFDFDDLLNANGELVKDEKQLLDSDQVRSGTDSPVQDSKISSSVAQLQASLAQNISRKGESVDKLGQQQQPALLPTPPLTISENKGLIKDYVGTPPVSQSPPVHSMPSAAVMPPGPRMMQPGPMLTQQQQQNQFLGMPRMMNPQQQGQFNPNFGQHIRPNMPQGPNYPMQMQGNLQRPPIIPQQQMAMQQRPMMMGGQNFPNQYGMGTNQMMGQQPNPMMNRGGVFSQHQRFPMAQRPMNQFQAQMQSNGYMGPQGNQTGFGSNAPIGVNMPPFIPGGVNNMMQHQNQQMPFNQHSGPIQPGIGPKMAPMSQTATTAPNPALMSEAEFYSYKERLKREAEQKMQSSSSSYRTATGSSSRYRRHRTRSRSYTSRSRSYSGSKSRSRSPRRAERNRSRNRSYSYSRSRSRSSSRSERRNRPTRTTRGRYSKSRSPVTGSYNSRNPKSSQSHKSYRGSSQSKTTSSYRSSTSYRRKSRSTSRSKDTQSKQYQEPPKKKSRSKTPQQQPQQKQRSRYSRSRSGSPSRKKSSQLKKNESSSKVDSGSSRDKSSRDKSPSKKDSKTKKTSTNVLAAEPKIHKENNYDQAVHKIMNKIRRPDDKKAEPIELPVNKDKEFNKDAKKVSGDQVELSLVSETEAPTKEKKSKKDKTEKERKHSKKSSKSEKSDADSKGEKRPSNSAAMQTINEDKAVEENQLEIEIDVKNDLEGSLVEPNSDLEVKRKKHKKSETAEESKDSSHKKHKKSKKHKKDKKSSSKDKKASSKDKEVLVEQNSLSQVTVAY